jgi:hypothetical protein
LTLLEVLGILIKKGGLEMKKSGEEKNQKILAVVKSLVQIKGTLYLCIPKTVARKCNLSPGNLATIIAGERQLTVVFPEPGA